MLQPSNYWQWQLDDNNQLLLDLDPTLVFATAYNKKQLTLEVQNDTAFNLSDAHYYQTLLGQLETQSQWSQAQTVQIALNATAVQRYYKPSMPKSWFFKTNAVQLTSAFPTASSVLCLLFTAQGYGQFLLVEHGESASVCMLLDETLSLSQDKQMSQFEIIKVMNDRLFQPNEIHQLKYA